MSRWDRLDDLSNAESVRLDEICSRTPGMTRYGNRARTAVMLPLSLAAWISRLIDNDEDNQTVSQHLNILLRKAKNKLFEKKTSFGEIQLDWKRDFVMNSHFEKDGILFITKVETSDGGKWATIEVRAGKKNNTFSTRNWQPHDGQVSTFETPVRVFHQEEEIYEQTNKFIRECVAKVFKS